MFIDQELDQELAVEPTWKPWSPTVGQRVRIRVSEECTALRAGPTQKETLTRFHSRSETGWVGTVVKETPGVWNPRQGIQGHDILIDFSPDSVHFQGCISFCALYFAAEELEPATDDRDDPLTDDLVGDSETRTQLAVNPPAIPKPHRTRRQRKDARRRARQPGHLSD